MSAVMLPENLQSNGGVQRSPKPRVLVLGMGATGASCARYFSTRDIDVMFADTRPNPPALAEIEAAMPQAVCATGANLPELPRTVEWVVLSPGVSLDLPLLATARARGLEIYSDIDLFFREVQAPVIGITGSNGKSTVTAMLAAALNAAAWRAPAGGNLGTPALDLVDPNADAYVLELSSFQLERSQKLPLEVAVILNVSPDHLDLHGDFSAYANAKARIYASCRHAVINRDVPGLQDFQPANAAVTGFTLNKPRSDDFGIREFDGRTYLACGRAPLLPVADLPVAGRHNLANALAALALGAAAGADLRAMVQGLRTFKGLPHRMEIVSRAHGIQWINDSKATNVAAAVASIEGTDGPLVLIAGGDAKGACFEPLADCLRNRRCRVLLMGKDSERMADALRDVCPCDCVPDMSAAVQAAHDAAGPGWTVLLAPAAASLDMYSSFAVRGEDFAAAVEALSP